MRSAPQIVALLAMLHGFDIPGAEAQERAASVLEQTRPEYPASERRLNRSGTVFVAVQIRADATVGECTVVRSSGSPLLDEAGLASVREWTFAAALDSSGQAIESRIEVPVVFEAPATSAQPSTDVERLAQIWLAYRSYKSVTTGIFDRCQAAGVETAPARANNARHDTGLDEKFQRLEAQLKEALLATGGVGDPDARLREQQQKLEAHTKLRIAQELAKYAADDGALRRGCTEFVLELGSLEGSFRFNDHYERLMTF